MEAVVEAVEEDLAEDLEHADPEALPETTAEAQLAAVAAIDDESESEVWSSACISPTTLCVTRATPAPSLCVAAASI